MLVSVCFLVVRLAKQIFSLHTCSFICFVILKICHHQSISHNLKWSQVSHDRKSEVKVSVSHSGPTYSPEEEAVQKCHVLEMKTFCLSPVLLPENWWILVFIALICSLHAEAPGDTHWSSLITLRTFIFVVVFKALLRVLCLSTHLCIF